MSEALANEARTLRFERLVAPWRDDLYRFAFWLCRDPHLADDVVQEAMLRAFRALDNLESEALVKTWLLTIVRREHARVYERKRLETTDIDELSAAEAALIATSDGAEVDDMRRAILELADEYREPLVLQVLMGLTTAEIAGALGLKQGAVLTRLHRARKQLAERFGAELGIVEK
ncbi:MAG TPA: sigma-70 family RNA polymerase sigma factor [Gammaproteobacteria bacterium]|nr:sigma-70 family RNA polymerase sigma factor [Gammaproteobacteria bacterium]